MDIHTAEPLVPEPSLFEVEIAIGKLKSYKSPGTDQIPTELIKAGGEIFCSEIYRIRSIWKKEQQWKEFIIIIILPNYRNGDKIVTIISCLQNCIQHSSGYVISVCQRNYWGSSIWVPS
jgi:hypothetical protein